MSISGISGAVTVSRNAGFGYAVLDDQFSVSAAFARDVHPDLFDPQLRTRPIARRGHLQPDHAGRSTTSITCVPLRGRDIALNPLSW
jgi:hypothetical protein